MRIGIDARFFGPVGKGLGRYTQKLIEHLELVADEHEFVIFLRKENFDLFQPTSSRFRKVLADFRWYTLEEQFRFPRLLKKERIDLMHFPHFNIPVMTPCPFVVTIHDLILLRYPTRRATTLNRFLYGIKYAAYRYVIRTAVKKSKRIIAVSEYTRQDIIRAFKVPKDKIVVTYEAAELPHAQAMPVDFEKRGINKPYFLYVGNAYPHKNLEMLLRVFAELRSEGLDAQLVLVGKADYFYDRLREVARTLKLQKDVIFYGYATDEELPTLYRNARAYVFPSLLEGFGLPPLEAMRHGSPVVASKASCLPEILGDAASYFDPESSDDMSIAMKTVFEDEALRASLVQKGDAQVRKYSWRTCATQTLELYHSSLR